MKTTILYCSNIGLKGCKLASQVDRYPFSALGPSQAHQVVDSNFFSFSALIHSVKRLWPISVIASIGMLNLSSTLALTPSVM
jgi:hypothetical protein